MFYKDFEVYGSPFYCHLKSSGTIQVKVLNRPDGWTVHTSDCQVIIYGTQLQIVVKRTVDPRLSTVYLFYLRCAKLT